MTEGRPSSANVASADALGDDVIMEGLSALLQMARGRSRNPNGAHRPIQPEGGERSGESEEATSSSQPGNLRMLWHSSTTR